MGMRGTGPVRAKLYRSLELSQQRRISGGGGRGGGGGVEREGGGGGETWMAA